MPALLARSYRGIAPLQSGAGRPMGQFFAATRIQVVLATMLSAWRFNSDCGLRHRAHCLPVLRLTGAIPAAMCSWLGNEKETDLRYRNSANGDLITAPRPLGDENENQTVGDCAAR